MGFCKLEAGIEFGCEQRKASAGAQSFFYVANLDEIDKASTTYGTDGEITSLVLKSVSGNQVYKIETPKNANDAGYEVQLGDTSGNPSFKHMVNMQLSGLDQTTLSVVQDIVYASNLVVFMPTKAKTIEVYGWDDGLSIETGTQTTGKLGTDNNLHQLLISGESNEIFKQYIDTDYDTSILALETLLTPVP